MTSAYEINEGASLDIVLTRTAGASIRTTQLPRRAVWKRNQKASLTLL
jgi:hypothetical protein